MSKRMMWPVLLIGIALIALPLLMSLPSKAAAGQRMLDNFNPMMQPASVNTTISYYNKTFIPLRPVAIVGAQAANEAPQMIGALASQLHMTPEQVQGFIGQQFPAIGKLFAALPSMKPVFTAVPAGLNHYRPLVDTMNANVSNYSQVDSLPNFNLLTWFFVLPGALLVLIAGFGLIGDRGAQHSNS